MSNFISELSGENLSNFISKVNENLWAYRAGKFQFSIFSVLVELSENIENSENCETLQ